ncbi:hypothetical protein BIFDEN_00721 [Bifidobacterium dentium ATCC 27678]|nr:hypothetical protein BIFDEN_00721 [Bifidobacterium dentium ATCC 27678]
MCIVVRSVETVVASMRSRHTKAVRSLTTIVARFAPRVSFGHDSHLWLRCGATIRP